MGSPGKVVKALSEEKQKVCVAEDPFKLKRIGFVQGLKESAGHYVRNAARFRAGLVAI
jgi:hypothetical protein